MVALGRPSIVYSRPAECSGLFSAADVEDFVAVAKIPPCDGADYRMIASALDSTFLAPGQREPAPKETTKTHKRNYFNDVCAAAERLDQVLRTTRPDIDNSAVAGGLDNYDAMKSMYFACADYDAEHGFGFLSGFDPTSKRLGGLPDALSTLIRVARWAADGPPSSDGNRRGPPKQSDVSGLFINLCSVFVATFNEPPAMTDRVNPNHASTLWVECVVSRAQERIRAGRYVKEYAGDASLEQAAALRRLRLVLKVAKLAPATKANHLYKAWTAWSAQPEYARWPAWWHIQAIRDGGLIPYWLKSRTE